MTGYKVLYLLGGSEDSLRTLCLREHPVATDVCYFSNKPACRKVRELGRVWFYLLKRYSAIANCRDLGKFLEGVKEIRESTITYVLGLKDNSEHDIEWLNKISTRRKELLITAKEECELALPRNVLNNILGTPLIHGKRLRTLRFLSAGYRDLPCDVFFGYELLLNIKIEELFRDDERFADRLNLLGIMTTATDTSDISEELLRRERESYVYAHELDKPYITLLLDKNLPQETTDLLFSKFKKSTLTVVDPSTLTEPCKDTTYLLTTELFEIRNSCVSKVIYMLGMDRVSYKTVQAGLNPDWKILSKRSK